MKLWTIWFWITAFVAFAVTALGSVNSSITRSYHPLIAENDLLFDIRVSAVFVVLGIIFGILLWRFAYPPTSPRRYKIAIACLCVLIVPTFVPFINSGTTQTVTLGETSYEVPWHLAPLHKDLPNGETALYITVKGKDLAPVYAGPGKRVRLGRSTDTSQRPAQGCLREKYSFDCTFHSDGATYTASGQIRDLPTNTTRMAQDIRAIFASLEVGE